MNRTSTRATRYLFDACEAKVGDALAKLVLIALANRANNSGECWPSFARIANDCETSESSVKRKIKVLEQGGFLKRINRSVEGMKTSNLYQLSDGSEGYIVGSEGHSSRVTVTPPVGSERPIKHAVETRKETERSKQFEVWYLSYPKKQSKKAAMKSFMSLKADALTACLADDLKARYKDTERKYIPLPSTYLNGERWEDETEFNNITAKANYL